MQIDNFFKIINKLGIGMYTGVPDSLLKPLCDYLIQKYGVSNKHIVAANEGAAVGLAAGHYLATSKPAMVYMQNSGIGNAVNPICSLINHKVYAIPTLFVIGFRGEPGVHDEPQHIFQGEITESLLKTLQIKYFLLTNNTSEAVLESAINEAKAEFLKGKSYAIVVKKSALQNDYNLNYNNNFSLSREEVVKLVVQNSNNNDVFVSTTGKLSRELFEIREDIDKNHKRDFLTVGSMGHSSMIALAIAKEKPNRMVYLLDGDGAVLMHLGNLAVLGANKPKNLVHILINNAAHETVGGIPTVANKINFMALTAACGYNKAFSLCNEEDLINTLNEIKTLEGPIFIEVKTNLNSRSNLGRPTTTPTENKENFIQFLNCDN